MSGDRLIQKYIFFFLILGIAVVIVTNLTSFIAAGLGATIFYVLFRNQMRKLCEKRKMNKTLAALIIILLSFFILVLPFTLMGTLIANKIIFYISQPDQINSLKDMVMEKIKMLPIDIKLDQMISKITENLGGVLSGVLNNVFGVLTTIVVMYFLLYYFLVNYGKLERSLIKYLPMRTENLNTLGEELKSMTFVNAVGVPIIAVVQGLIAFGLYKYADVADAGLWAILTGAASIIPLVGTGLIWLPITIVFLAMGKYVDGLVVGIGCLIVLGNIDNLIRMYISKKMGDVHPVVTFLGVFMGLNIFGIPGLVFGPLIISYFLIFIKMFKLEYGANEPGVIKDLIENIPNEPPGI
ncbi:MAG: AI-2E family transporter [Saprospiraceae bacterium]|nr:AI-2E family transporter [Candidatus Brachybacter algidus]